MESLHAQVEALGLQDIVSFEPPAPMTQLPAWYRHCTVHVNLLRPSSIRSNAQLLKSFAMTVCELVTRIANNGVAAGGVPTTIIEPQPDWWLINGLNPIAGPSTGSGQA